MPAQRAVLFANGEIQNWDKISGYLLTGALIIAVDGGAAHCLRLKLHPDVLIGDLDSVDASQVEALAASGTQIQKYPADKDETDLELAIQYALERGAQELILFGGLGGRLDHTLGNLALLFHPMLRGKNVSIVEGNLEISAFQDKKILKGHPGDIVSLIPWGGDAAGVTTQRMKYPLKEETLVQYKTRGISNVMLADTAEVRIQGGALLCVHTHAANASVC